MQDFCGKTMQAVTGQPMNKFFFFNFLVSLLATNRLSKSLRTLGARLLGARMTFQIWGSPSIVINCGWQVLCQDLKRIHGTQESTEMAGGRGTPIYDHHIRYIDMYCCKGYDFQVVQSEIKGKEIGEFWSRIEYIITKNLVWNRSPRKRLNKTQV